MRTLVAWIEGQRVGTFTESPRPDGSIHSQRLEARHNDALLKAGLNGL